MNLIQRRLQQNLNSLQNWANQNGFKFSQTKTVCMHFCNKRKQHAEPELYLSDVLIPVVKEFKFLGLIFDSKLNFIPHIKELKRKCQKALNLLRVVSAQNWGADRNTKLMLYRALIRSRLDYGSIVYGSARASYLKILDPVQNQGLRLCLNAFRTSPTDSLHIEANEQPLNLRRIKLSMQYAIKLYANKQNPTHKTVFGSDFSRFTERAPTVIPPFGARVLPHLEQAGILLESIANYKISTIPTWRLTKPLVLKQLSSTSKDITDPNLFQTNFAVLKENYKDYHHIYTDGSKLDNKAAAAVVTENNILRTRLPDGASIFSAEIRALHIATEIIKISRYKKFVIFVDSMSVLESIENINLANPLITDLLRKHEEAITAGKEILFCWVPSHVGIRGNEVADKAAKQALSLNCTDILIPSSDFKYQINKYIKDKWQNQWNELNNNKLYQINPRVGQKPPILNNVRDEMVIHRIRIGHTYLTHKHLLRGEPPPECTSCQQRYTVKHILLDCTDFQHVRTNHFTANTMKELFDNTDLNNIIAYLKAINIYDLI